MKKYILFIILILVIVFLLKNYSEHYTNLQNNSTKNLNAISERDNTIKINSTLRTKNVRKGTDPLDGKLFDDVLLHRSDDNLEGELGLEKCIKKCKGMCVEYGMTGDAYCFPEDYLEVKNKYLESINSELKARPLN